MPIPDQSRTSLYDLETELMELIEFRESAEDEETRQATEQAISSYIQLEIAKVDRVRSYIRHCEMMAGGAQEEEDRQAQRRQAWSRRAQLVKQMVYGIMKHTGKMKLEGRTGHFQIKNNGGKIPLLIDDEMLIPNKFCDFPKIPRKDAIRTAIEAQESVPGARLGERGDRLEVK